MEQRANLKFCVKVEKKFAELVEKVRKIIGIDANFTTRMQAEELNTSKNTIWRILTEDLGKRKVCARFVSHQLNAPPQKTKKVNEFFMKKRISLINHPPHSPDLSPCDYFLFPKLKTKMKGAFYDDIPAIQVTVTEVLKNIPINDIKKSMHALVDRSKRYIESNGTYFE